MKPRRTVNSNFTFVLIGGNEDSDLWATIGQDEDGDQCITTVWQPSDEEREAIANGQNIELVIWGNAHPATKVGVTDVQLGRAPGGETDG